MLLTRVLTCGAIIVPAPWFEGTAELRAQVELAKKKGVNVQYLDSHYMGYDSYPGLGNVIMKMGRDYNLPLSETFNEKGISVYTVPVKEKKR